MCYMLQPIIPLSGLSRSLGTTPWPHLYLLCLLRFAVPRRPNDAADVQGSPVRHLHWFIECITKLQTADM